MAATQTDVFSVTGMTCGSCVAHVEKALLGRDDVSAVSVDLAGGQVTVTHDPATDTASLFETVRAVGYEAGPLI